MNKIGRYFWIIRTKFMGFSQLGKKSCVYEPLQIDNPQGIHIGDSVFVGQNSWLMGSKLNGEKGLIIRKNTTIGHYAHIIAMKEVVIENDVLLADKVFISDCSHNYRDPVIPIKNQGISYLKAVCIGEGSWIGENVCICGANVGKHCVIGANSVVTKDIPDYCVAAGIPAKVIKKYDIETKDWISV